MFCERFMPRGLRFNYWNVNARIRRTVERLLQRLNFWTLFSHLSFLLLSDGTPNSVEGWHVGRGLYLSIDCWWRDIIVSIKSSNAVTSTSWVHVRGWVAGRWVFNSGDCLSNRRLNVFNMWFCNCSDWRAWAVDSARLLSIGRHRGFTRSKQGALWAVCNRPRAQVMSDNRTSGKLPRL